MDFMGSGEKGRGQEGDHKVYWPEQVENSIAITSRVVNYAFEYIELEMGTN